jgi:hypothetical protein
MYANCKLQIIKPVVGAKASGRGARVDVEVGMFEEANRRTQILVWPCQRDPPNVLVGLNE